MKRLTVRMVRKVFVQSAFGKALAVLMALGWLLPSYALAVAFSDQQPPTIHINIPDDSLWVKQVIPKIVVKDDTDPNPTYSVRLGNEPYKVGTPIRDPGYYELQIHAQDASGNASEKTVSFQVLEQPHYIASLAVVHWDYKAEGDWAGLEAWLLLYGPFIPDRRLISLNNYPETIPVCVVQPLHFTIHVIDEEGNLLSSEPILPAGFEECEVVPPAPCKSVYYDYRSDVVALHFRVTPSERVLHKGTPARIKIVGWAEVKAGGFTFETAAEPSANSLLSGTLQDVIKQGNCNPCTHPTSQQKAAAQCRCRWVSFPQRNRNPDLDGDVRSRGCAISPGYTDEKYKINARPSRIDGYGYTIDLCEAQEGMIPTPGHRGVVSSGFEATPALQHVGPCCCEDGPAITLSGSLAFSVTVRTRGDARSAIAGVIRVANDIEDIQAAGGLDLGNGASGGADWSS